MGAIDGRKQQGDSVGISKGHSRRMKITKGAAEYGHAKNHHPQPAISDGDRRDYAIVVLSWA